MAKPYPIVPASVLDELRDLNCSLMAYQYAIEAILRRAAEDGLPYDISSLVCGLDSMSRPILEGYQSIYSQVQSFREFGFVGVGTVEE
ncbi:hypothetical protein QYP02_36390 [Pseudomonas aeruginosa]|nr:hypothetical protein [Pseudomonas aeruginosa]